MDLTEFSTQPYWWDDAPPEVERHPLPERADVVVIGSGYCGLSAAIELARAGCQTVVLEAGSLGCGASTRSGGMVSSGQKLVRANSIRGVSPSQINRMLEDSCASFNHLEQLIAREELDAAYRRTGRFFAAYAPKHYQRLQRMGEALREKTGVVVHDIPRSEQHRITATDFYHGGIVVDDYGGLHPGRFTRALIKLARRNGAHLCAFAEATNIVRINGGFYITTVRGVIAATEVVIATNGYTGALSPFLRKRVIPVPSYLIATERVPRSVMDEVNPGRRMISDTENELIYTRPSPDGTRIIFGTRPSIFDVDERRAARQMSAQLQAIWPQLKPFRITHSWRGTVAMTFDRIAHMGVHEGLHYATGCNGNGVALMTYLGHQIALKILGRQRRPCAFDRDVFPTEFFYAGGKPWFLPLASAYYRLADAKDRSMSELF